MRNVFPFWSIHDQNTKSITEGQLKMWTYQLLKAKQTKIATALHCTFPLDPRFVPLTQERRNFGTSNAKLGYIDSLNKKGSFGFNLEFTERERDRVRDKELTSSCQRRRTIPRIASTDPSSMQKRGRKKFDPLLLYLAVNSRYLSPPQTAEIKD